MSLVGTQFTSFGVPPSCQPVQFMDPANSGLIQFNTTEEEEKMFIVVEHIITNPDAFFGLVSEVDKAPSGLKALQFFPSISKDRAVCVWQANSVDALRGFLEPLSSKSSKNTYYAVDKTLAMGLPNMAAAA